MSNGTPKNLIEAIMNGLEQFMPNCGPREELAHHIEPHIQDFLSQKFGVVMLTADEDYTRQKILSDLFFVLTGRKVK